MSEDQRDRSVRVEPGGRVVIVAGDGSERVAGHLGPSWVEHRNGSGDGTVTVEAARHRPARSGPVWGTQRYLLRPDVSDPSDWTVLPDGRLLAPAVPGKKRRLSYSRESLMGRRVLARRRAVGLSTEP